MNGSNIPKIYNAKAWIGWLTGLSLILTSLLGYIPPTWGKIIAIIGGASAIARAIADMLVKAAAVLFIGVLLALSGRSNAQELPRYQSALVCYKHQYEYALVAYEHPAVVRRADPIDGFLHSLSFTTIYTFKQQRITGAVLVPLHHFWVDEKRGLVLDGDSFAGMTQNGLGAVGFALVLNYTPPKFGKLSVQIGGAVQLVSGHANDAGLLAGFAYKY